MNIYKITSIIWGITFLSIFAQDPCNSEKVLTNYSFFSEYYRAKEYALALPYGWRVLECDKKKYAKWIYYKMETCFVSLHDSSDISEGEIQAIEDTILTFYDMAIQYYPESKEYFENNKANVIKTWITPGKNNSESRSDKISYKDLSLDIFSSYTLPIGIGILKFEGTSDLHTILYDELKVQPGIHRKFTIFPYEILDQQKEALGIEGEINTENEDAMDKLFVDLDIDIVITGKSINSNEYILKIYSTNTGIKVFESKYKNTSNSSGIKDAMMLFTKNKKTVY